MKGIASAALKNLRRPDLIEHRAFLGGVWVERSERLSVIDPAGGGHLVDVTACSLDDVDSAIEAASAAFLHWRETLPVERGDILRSWGELMRDNARDLATIISAEQGKPFEESLGKFPTRPIFSTGSRAKASDPMARLIPSHLKGGNLSVRMQPIGVTAAITPWNFPSAMIARKAGAALAAGCTMIVKPAPETPLSALALAKLAEEAGMPAGVLQVLPGEAAPLARRLLEHTDVRAFSFTGSTEVGRLPYPVGGNRQESVAGAGWSCTLHRIWGF